MDLKTFAVNRKLTYDHDLLSYVMDGKAIPLDILETSLGELIGPMTDEASSMLLTDYTKMLREHVPITVSQDETGNFTISGDVPDTVLESIEMVHGVGAEEAISEMIANNMSLLSDRKVEVSGLDLTAHAEKMLMGSAVPKVTSAGSMMSEAAITQMSEEVQVKTEQMAQAVAQERPVIEGTPVYAPETVPYVAPEPAPYVAPEPAYVEPAPEPAYVAPEPVAPPTVDNEPQDVKAAVKRVYDKIVQDISASRIDERLGIVV